MGQVASTCRALISWAMRAKAVLDNGVKIDRLLVQLPASEHRPMAIDDLRGLDALGPDLGQDLADRFWRRQVGGDHLLKRQAVGHHRTEWLTEILCDRAGQRLDPRQFAVDFTIRR
jgi:hypothetical protein